MAKKKLNKKNLNNATGGMPETHVVVSTESVSATENMPLLNARRVKKTTFNLGADKIDAECHTEYSIKNKNK